MCFTYNNYEDGWEKKLQEAEWINYGCVGEEVGELGTAHLQGYIQFKRARSKAVTDKLEKLLGRRPHCEIAAGNLEQNQKYCKKEGKFIEWGEPVTQGKRMDLEKAFDDAADTSKSMLEVATENKSTFIRYHRGIEKVRELTLKEEAKAWREVEVIFITGPTGCGKTREAMASGENIYKIQGSQLQWWDGYEGEDTILIDEYSNDVKVTELLALLDGYKLRLPVKGGFTYAAWTKVYITSNLARLHEQAKDAHRDALQRRITTTKNYWEASGIDERFDEQKVEYD